MLCQKLNVNTGFFTVLVIFVFFIAGCLASAATDDDDQMDWVKYYFDHYLGYGTPWYYTGLHAPTFDFSDLFKTPTISNIQDLLKSSGSDANSMPSQYNQNTGFLITSSPPGADVLRSSESPARVAGGSLAVECRDGLA